MNVDLSFGKWLKRRRRGLDLTQKELAQRVGCGVSTIRKIEAGERRPSKELAARLATCLALPPDEHKQFIIFARTEPYADAVSPSTTLIAPTIHSVPVPSPFLEQEITSQENQMTVVAREPELAELEAKLEMAQAGQSQLLFIAGEAGSGKTALMEAFVQQALVTDPELVVSFGHCNAHTGPGNPYLPFRDVLNLLTGQIKPHYTAGFITPEQTRRLGMALPTTMQALLDHGTFLIDSLIPANDLLTRAAAAMPGRTDLLNQLRVLAEQSRQQGGELEQSQLFDQFTDFLRASAAVFPLLIILDDLHWADTTSIDLLHHLGRRLGDSRLLILGTYRPEEVALGRRGERHPLEKALAEFKRHFGKIEVNLDEATAARGRAFVNAYLDTTPNRLGETFRAALHQHTGGQPLFTVELLRILQERGSLVQDEQERWIQGTMVDWSTLPARVEGVIEERIGRLAAHLKEILTIASVEGVDFTAQVVAQVQQASLAGLVRQLSSDLERKHHLVQEQGSQQVGQQRLYNYRFRHHLFQQYLYDSLGPVERELRHSEVGSVLEALFGDKSETIAPQLAWHFTQAGLPKKAIDYWQKAGALAVRSYANQEAVTFFSQAIALLQTIEDTPERTQQEFRLLLALGTPMANLKGYAAPEIKQIYQRARELSPQVEATPHLFITLQGLCFFYWVRQVKLHVAETLAEQCLELARRLQHPAFLVSSYRLMGGTHFYLGQLKSAWDSLAQGIDLYTPEQQQSLVRTYGAQDDGLFCYIYGAYTLWLLGYPEQALHTVQKGVALAMEADDPNTLILLLSQGAGVFQFYRQSETTQQLAEKANTILTEQGTQSHLVGFATFMDGWALFDLGQQAEGLTQMSEGFTKFRAAGAMLTAQIYLPTILAEVYGQAGQVEAGLTLLDKTFSNLDDYEERFWEAELYRVKGDLLRLQGVSEAEVEPFYQQAIEISQKQSAKSLELRAAMSLCRLWQEQGKKEEAYQMLAEIYDWFTEGLDTADLHEAKLLLEELS
jgi:transcriptional regulator with XRE-family HTH domain/tetratricopeptide (TPR) repeat protein